MRSEKWKIVWCNFERYARGGDTRGEGKNEVRLRTVRENHEERKKWDTWRVPKEKTHREQKLRRELEQQAQGDTREKKNVTRVTIEQQVRETREERRNKYVLKQ